MPGVACAATCHGTPEESPMFALTPVPNDPADLGAAGIRARGGSRVATLVDGRPTRCRDSHLVGCPSCSGRVHPTAVHAGADQRHRHGLHARWTPVRHPQGRRGPVPAYERDRRDAAELQPEGQRRRRTRPPRRRRGPPVHGSITTSTSSTPTGQPAHSPFTTDWSGSPSAAASWRRAANDCCSGSTACVPATTTAARSRSVRDGKLYVSHGENARPRRRRSPCATCSARSCG